MIKNVYRASCKVSIIVVRFQQNSNFHDRVFYNHQNMNFMKIRPIGRYHSKLRNIPKECRCNTRLPRFCGRPLKTAKYNPINTEGFVHSLRETTARTYCNGLEFGGTTESLLDDGKMLQALEYAGTRSGSEYQQQQHCFPVSMRGPLLWKQPLQQKCTIIS